VQAQARADLLAADAGLSDDEIALSVGVGGSTVYRFVEANLERALSEEPPPGAQRKLTGRGSLDCWWRFRNRRHNDVQHLWGRTRGGARKSVTRLTDTCAGYSKRILDALLRER
jgi:hypothetical protein